MATQDDINAFNASSTPACLLVLAAQTNNETANRTIAVATVNDLPDLTLNTITPGTVLWVNSLNIPVVAQVGCWTGLDDREVRSDFPVGLAWAWGNNTCGRLGDNTTTNRLSPVSVVGGFIDWRQVSTGCQHSLGVRVNGTAWAWGWNRSGRFGDNAVGTCTSSPVSVAGGFTDWCAISAGGEHSLALRTGGTAWAWGCWLGVGDNRSIDRSSPVSVAGGFSDWCQIGTGFNHSLGVRTGGSAWAWGFNFNGHLGDGTTVTKSSPVSVVGGFSNWCQVAGGSAHSVAVRTNCTAWAWGWNSSGQLGNNSTTDRSSPVSVVGQFDDWCRISAGAVHSVATRIGGSTWAWGLGNDGRLGDNTTTNKSSPVSVVGGFSDWCAVSGGDTHSAALRTNGTVWGWGRNTAGQLGDTTVTARSSPVSAVGGFTDWSQVDAGNYQTIALRQF